MFPISWAEREHPKKVYHARRSGPFESPVKTGVTEVTIRFNTAALLCAAEED
jgi:hypothetical protein